MDVSSVMKKDNLGINVTRLLAGLAGMAAMVSLIVLGCQYAHTLGTTASLTESFKATCFKVAMYSAIAAAVFVVIAIAKTLFESLQKPKPPREFFSEIGLSLLSPLLGAGITIYALAKK